MAAPVVMAFLASIAGQAKGEELGGGKVNCSVIAENVLETENIRRTSDVDAATARKIDKLLGQQYWTYYRSGCSEEALSDFYKSRNSNFAPRRKEEVTHGGSR
jgi:hypothetical protein